MLLQVNNSNVSICLISTNIAISMETILLKDMVKQDGQLKAADKIGCHQTAVSAALKKKREIYLELQDGKIVSGYEVKPALGLPFIKHKKA